MLATTLCTGPSSLFANSDVRDGRLLIERNLVGKLSSFVCKTTLWMALFGAFFLFFWLFFAERTQLTFRANYSCLNRCTFLSWVRLVKIVFYIDSPAPTSAACGVVAAVPAASGHCTIRLCAGLPPARRRPDPARLSTEALPIFPFRSLPYVKQPYPLYPPRPAASSTNIDLR